MAKITKTFQYGKHTVTLETGEIARQASGAVIVKMDDTVLLVTAVAAKSAREGQDFFPLTVDYQEKFYAGGRIPGGFFKREGRATEKETLISRLIDRPIRPLFPEDYRNEVQIIATVMSLNPDVDGDIAALIGASAALSLAGTPFKGPIGAAKVGYKNGEYILNPSVTELKDSELELVVAGTSNAVLMVESEAALLSEEVMLGAVTFGHREMQKVINAINELTVEAGTKPSTWVSPAKNDVLISALKEAIGPRLGEAFQVRDKLQRRDAIAATRPLQYGLVVHRAALRTFPTMLRVFSRPGDTDIDRFQESALFPGDAVAVLHESADGQWLLVTSERYTAWIEKRFVGVGDKATVLKYGQPEQYRVVTGATVFTTFTPEEPRVSRLQLDMGVRVPLLADWPLQQPVNGQQAHASYVVQLPVRNDDGSLALVPALIARSQDTSDDYLELSPRNLYAQAFKFLGERYGWGHSYDTRDCSGFVSEVYRSFGILMPRNTSAQAVSPALDRIAFSDKDSKAKRMEAVKNLQPGDLVYIPGHVMLTLGHFNGNTWMIHDTAGGSWFAPDGTRVQAHLNGVSVTPLEPMMASDTASYIDRITNIQRMRAKTP